jgi:hypothetical protein
VINLALDHPRLQLGDLGSLLGQLDLRSLNLRIALLQSVAI